MHHMKHQHELNTTKKFLCFIHLNEMYKKFKGNAPQKNFVRTS